MTSPVYKYLLLILILIYSSLQMTHGCTFCRMDRVAAHFDPIFSIECMGAPDRFNKVSDLIPLLAKLSEDFQTVAFPFFHPSEAKNTSLKRIPKAIAAWNAETSKTTNPKPLEAWVLLQDKSVQSGTNFQEFVTIAEKEMSKANYIYNNTITTIRYYPFLGQFNAELVLQNVHLARNIFPQTKYKLGLVFYTDDFPKLMSYNYDHYTDIHSEIFSIVNHIEFKLILNGIQTDTPVEVIVKREIDAVKEYTQFIRKITNNTNLPITVWGTWSDTTNDGKANYTKVIQYWESLLLASKSENFTLLITAFDDPFNENPLRITWGWWKLRENSSYTSTSQYVFDDKKSIAKREKENTPEKLLSELKDDIDFDRNNFMVRFSPITATFETEIAQILNLTSISKLLSKITGNFSSLLIAEQDYQTLLESKEALLKTFDIIADNNANAEFPLNVIYLLNNKENKEQWLRLLLEIIEDTTAYPSFIKTVAFFQPPRIPPPEVRIVLNQRGIQMGVTYPIVSCAGTSYEFAHPPLADWLKTVDIVYYSYLPGENHIPNYLVGVDRILSQVTTLFESCKNRFANLLPNTKVAFLTGYPDTMMSKKEDYISLVIFWKGMNAWAKRTNTTVIMFEAFDSTHTGITETNSYQYMGWWRVTGRSSQNNELGIEEKRSLAIKKLEESITKEIPEDISQIGLNFMTPVIASLAAITVIILIVFASYKYRKASRNIATTEIFYLDISNCDILCLPSTAFLRESSKIIGIGNFGIVYKCYMSQFQTTVAVKTTSSSDDDSMTNALKCLMSEIKIMSYVGEHENLLRLLGVCQENMVFVVTEYCENGSLLTYLRSLAAEKLTIEMYELSKFCMEIANGMVYLEEKNVIHGDLSARNVLLDGNKTCKVSDFGLSRKLEQYECYMKQGKEPLPWRWMAFESLTKMEFSAKSDVWSMGVTFWEVFSLGKVPYPETTWNEKFCESLAEGVRLVKPEFCDDIIYQVILSCWQIEANSRPSSKDLFLKFREIKSSADYTAVAV